MVRLGVVLDTRNPPDRVRMIARMCELAGIDAVWVRDGLVDPSEAFLDPWEALALAAAETRRTRLGAMLDAPTRGWEGLEGPLLKAAQSTEMAGRLEITMCGDWHAAAALVERAQGLHQPTLGVEVHNLGEMRTAARLADDVLLPNPSHLRTTVLELAEACAAEGRQASSLGVALQLPVSIGRTETEAHARMVDEALFAGDANPALSGIFGTLEMCQDRVIELAHAGVTDLRCILPNSADVHDVIAQLTAMVVGSIDVLQPGAPRSKAPDAPAKWGGRPRFPSAN